MRARILIVNPNSSPVVTAGIDQALEPLRLADGPLLECVTLSEGPPAIETQRQVDGVVEPLCRLVEREQASAEAFVIACFSDPGLHALRELTPKPVLGIAECGLLTALLLGDRVGVVSILAASLPRHRRLFRTLGIEARIAGDLPVDLHVDELAGDERVAARLTTVGARLRDEAGAAVLVLGCAGMARQRLALEAALGLPVVDPTQAAAGMALSAVRLGYRVGPARK
jgi:Asp/Glu/hydantoin racemase